MEREDLMGLLRPIIQQDRLVQGLAGRNCELLHEALELREAYADSLLERINAGESYD